MSLSQSFQIWQRARGLTMQSMFIRTMAQMSRLHCTADMISAMALSVQEFMHHITMNAHIWMAWRILISF